MSPVLSDVLLPPRSWRQAWGGSAGSITCASECSEIQPRGVGRRTNPVSINCLQRTAARYQSLRSSPPEVSRLVRPAQLQLGLSAPGRCQHQRLVSLPSRVYFCSRAAAKPSTSVNKRFSRIFFSSSQPAFSYHSHFCFIKNTKILAKHHQPLLLSEHLFLELPPDCPERKHASR